MKKETVKEKNEETKHKEIKHSKFNQIKNDSKKVEENLEKMVEKTKKKRKIGLAVLIISIIIIVLALIFSTIFALLNMNKTTICNGIKIEGIDMTGLSADEAKAKLENIYKEKLNKELLVHYEDYETSINANVLQTKYDIEKSVNQAINIGRDSNIFVNNYKILWSLLGKIDIDVDMQLDDEIAKKTISDIGTNLPGVVIDSAYFIEDGKLTITKGQAGIKIDTDALLNKIKENLNDIHSSDDYIDIPVVQQDPSKIDIDKIHNDVYKEVQDAYYTKDPFSIHPEVEGIDFDVEAARKMLQEDKEQYVIDLIITKPKVTTDQIGTEAFPDLLSSHKTTYDGGNVDRTTNLRLASEKINGKVVMPGETFSYNKTLGPRSSSTGYKNAKIYSNGQVIDGIGGGICQISSTLYNAVLKANLEIVERKNHQFVTSYIEAGMDATVVYGMTDFKFKNTRKYPIKIIASSKNGVASVSIYGIKEAEEYTFSFRTVTISTIPTSTKYIEDPTLDVGVEQVKQKGVNGRKTETYMTKMLNGKVVSTTVLSRDTYDPMQKIILKGTKSSGTNNKSNVNSNNSTNNSNSTQNQTATPSPTPSTNSSNNTASPAPSTNTNTTQVNTTNTTNTTKENVSN